MKDDAGQRQIAEELAEAIRQLTHFLDGLWTLEDPGAYMRTTIEFIGHAGHLAHTIDTKPAVKARHVLRRVRIIIGRDRDVDWCATPEEAKEMVKNRMATAYQKCGKELEELASELLVPHEPAATGKKNPPGRPPMLDRDDRIRQLCKEKHLDGQWAELARVASVDEEVLRHNGGQPITRHDSRNAVLGRRKSGAKPK